MKAKELVGKKAIRTAPVSYGNGNSDYSYTSDPITILKATNSHIVYKHNDIMLEGRVSILDSRWNDNNWIDYDELMNLDNVKKDNSPKIVAINH